MDQIAVLLAPGHVPDQLGGSYEDACAALRLPPAPDGYALFLLDQMNCRVTVISTGTGEVRQAAAAHRDGGDGRMRGIRVAADDIADIRSGWPEEFGGGTRCQFCGALYPAWVYEGAEVEVLLGEPFLGFEGEPLPVVGSDVTGCADWHACGTCHDLIEAADFAAWRGLLGRYGDPDVPMPVQSAWREFWGNHRPPGPAAPPEWTPARRRRIAYEMTADWDAYTAGLPEGDGSSPGPAVTTLDAVRSYLRQPPPEGRIRAYPAAGGAAVVRADGDGWSLVGRTGTAAFLLLDSSPYTLHAIGAETAHPLLNGLARLAPARPGATAP